MGHEVFFCAGELGGYASAGTLIPLMHFQHPAILGLNERAFSGQADQDTGQLMDEIHQAGGGDPACFTPVRPLQAC